MRLVKLRRDWIDGYLLRAPLSLALYRTLECELLAREPLEHPILDVGCGDGIFASVLLEEPLDTGIDPQPHEVERARATGMYGELIVCSGDAVPKPDASYRTILSNSTLEHIPELEPVLRELHRLLAPDGRLVITVPSDRLQRFSLGSRLLRALRRRRAADAFESRYNALWKHYSALSPEEWEALFARTGFRVEERLEYGCAGSVLAFDLMLPLALPARLTQRLAGRWIASRRLRSWYLALPRAVLRRLLDRDSGARPGAMLLYRLRR
jgi:SAM-dependent methyltransferase